MFSSLRDRYEGLHERFGTAGLVIAVIALIAALAGTAIAAGGLTGKQKKEVTKIAKKYAGKNGAPGAQGPAGPAGPAGANGKDGAQGAPGQDGTAGKSVVLTNTAPSCSEGGISVEVEGTPASKKQVCNGEPWTAGGTLPEGETETGAWSFGKPGATSAGAYVPISFPIPLAAPLAAGNRQPGASPPVEEPGQVHYIDTSGKEVVLNEETFATEEVTQTNCPGSAASPEADPGHLCVYEGDLVGGVAAPWSNFSIVYPASPTFKSGASTSGAVLIFTSLSETSFGTGTWAVTAP